MDERLAFRKSQRVVIGMMVDPSPVSGVSRF